MTKEQAKEYVKSTPPPKGYFTEARVQYQGQPSYICPNCGNGSGEKGTGFHHDPHTPGYYKCFSCEEYGDIIHFIGLNEGIDPNSVEAFNKAYEVYGLTLDNQEGHNTPQNEPERPKPKEVEPVIKPEDVTGQEQYFKRCSNRLDLAIPYLKDRGISIQTARKYGLGYDPSLCFSYDVINGALIIPTSGGTYEARNLDPEAKQRWTASTGTRIPFNIEVLNSLKPTQEVYITEGAMDALSVLELGYPAIGLGGATKYFLQYLDGVQNKPHILIAMDNDDPGREKANRLSSQLSERKINHTIVNIAGNENDPNDLLRTNRQELEERLRLGRISPEERESYLKSNAKEHIKPLLQTIRQGTYTPLCNTGFDLLDEELGDGLFMGLYILGAGSSVGKTTYLLQMIDQVAQSGQDVIIFSLEMGKHELMAKSISRHTAQLCIDRDVNLRNAKTSNGILNQDRYITYDPVELKIIEDAIVAYGAYADNIYIHEGQGDITAQSIRETVDKHILFTGNRPVILIDYLQLIPPHEPRWSDKQNMDYAVSSLRRTARDCNIPVIVVSSYNRASYGTEANLGAFKESGAIEYSADVALALQFTKKAKKEKGKLTDSDLANHERNEKRKDTRSLELVILKNRNGKTGGKLYYEYRPALNLFTETFEPVEEERI